MSKKKEIDIKENDWKTFLELSNDGIVIADKDGRIVYLNRTSEMLMEVNREDIIGRTVDELEESGVYDGTVTPYVLKKKQTHTIMQFKGEKQIVTTGSPIMDGNKVKWVFINERDITELSKARTAYNETQSALESTKKELGQLKTELESEGRIVSRSALMKKTMELAGRVAGTDATVLIEGESGVGKTMIARWIHENSEYSEGAYVTVDCGALPESLLESELFGYEKGAFTGASGEGKKGLVEIADNGTLLLDEIGELTLSLQAKLLRLLQDRSYLPVGGVEMKKVNIRIIAATNQKLEEMVREKKFREDLYYRLNVVPIMVPPLRERPTDIDFLVSSFLEKYSKRYNVSKKLDPDARKLMLSYTWPGNVRELKNMIERLVIMTAEDRITEEDVYFLLQSSEKDAPADQDAGMAEIVKGRQEPAETYREARDRWEREFILYNVGRGVTIRELAEQMEMSESSLKRRLRKHGIRLRRSKEEGHN